MEKQPSGFGERQKLLARVCGSAGQAAVLQGVLRWRQAV